VQLAQLSCWAPVKSLAVNCVLADAYGPTATIYSHERAVGSPLRGIHFLKAMRMGTPEATNRPKCNGHICRKI